jgi:hypothetical protein
MFEPLMLLLYFGGLALIGVIIRWLNPPPKPPEDEWQKWKDL